MRVDTNTDVKLIVAPAAVQSIYEIKVFAPFAALFVEKFVDPMVNVLPAQEVYEWRVYCPSARRIRIVPVEGVSAGIDPVITTDVTAAPVKAQLSTNWL